MAEPHVCAPIDANGNLTSDGARTFEWDARNQLLAVNVGTHRSEFTYDGEKRRVRIVEKENSVVQSDMKVIWCEDEICEERAADSVTVTRRPLTLGEQNAGVDRFFGLDHLGSVGDVTDTASALAARYAFDPWGRRTLSAGNDVTPIGYTGHQHHTAGVSLTFYRAYDSAIGRWASEDPAGLSDGPNRFAYVGNNPINRIDRLGLQLEHVLKYLPWVRKRQRSLQKGIETLWTSCDQGKKLYHEEPKFNPAVEREKWRDFQDAFRKECSKASGGGSTISQFRQSGGVLALGAWAVGVCCELPSCGN